MKIMKLLPKLEQVVMWFSLSLIASILFIVLHNYVSGLLGYEEPVLFTLSMVSMIVYGILTFYLVVVGIVFLLKKK